MVKRIVGVLSSERDLVARRRLKNSDAEEELVDAESGGGMMAVTGPREARSDSDSGIGDDPQVEAEVDDGCVWVFRMTVAWACLALACSSAAGAHYSGRRRQSRAIFLLQPPQVLEYIYNHPRVLL